jgi:hypothetical protein
MSLFGYFKKNKFFALLDGQTYAVLVVSNYIEPLFYLSEFDLDSNLVELKYDNYFTYKFYEKLLSASEPFEYRYDKFHKKLFTNNNLKEYLKDKSKLIKEKALAIEEVLSRIIFFRQNNHKNLHLQDDIYLYKEIEANNFKNRGYPDDEILDYPFILQYADFKEIDYKTATEEILFKSKLYKGSLARTEELRIQTLKKIKEAKDFSEVRNAILQFRQAFIM